MVGFFFVQMYTWCMEEKFIRIRGARAHNLDSIDIDLPLNKIICFAGPSGSGKSSLAFHTLMNESRRRLLNSFPNSFKFFSDKPSAVDVDSINPVLPVFGLPQINPVMGTRSVVSDVMGITQLYQTLFFKYSSEICPVHKKPLVSKKLIENFTKYKDGDVIHIFMEKNDFKEVLANAPMPARVWDEELKTVVSFDETKHYWEIARFKFPKIKTFQELIEQYPKVLTKHIFINVKSSSDFRKLVISTKVSCPICFHKGLGELSSAHFTPYNALGACKECKGYGANLEYDEDKLFDKDKSVKDGAITLLNYKSFDGMNDALLSSMRKKKLSITTPIKDLEQGFWDLLYKGDKEFAGFEKIFKYFEKKRYKRNIRIFVRRIQKEVLCTKCLGTRINSQIMNRSIINDEEHPLGLFELYQDNIFTNIQKWKKIKVNKEKHFSNLQNKVLTVLNLACNIGLGHLALSRKSKSLSPGEYQRLLLLKYLAFEGTESLFIFDEPSLGLTINEQSFLLEAFKKICQQGNTVILIDHSEFFHRKTDQLVMMGPGAGYKGGKITYQGPPESFFRSYKKPLIEKFKIQKIKQNIHFSKIEIRDLVFSNIDIPVNQLTWVYGEAGAGKSSCFIKGIANFLNFKFGFGKMYDEFPQVGYYSVPKFINNVLVIESNLNRYTSRSSVGSITELFSVTRKHFLSQPEAKAMKLKDGHLSYNSVLGQCPACEGKGVKVIEMQYMEDIILECEDCKGIKLKPIYSQLNDGKISVSEAYEMPIEELMGMIKLTPKFNRITEYLKILKLDYLSLNRPINTLSGGEKQRLYLLSCLIKEIKNSLLFFENLSFGLSAVEIASLATFLQNLTLADNTIVIIDSNPIFSEICANKIKMGQKGELSIT